MRAAIKHLVISVVVALGATATTAQAVVVQAVALAVETLFVVMVHKRVAA